MTMSDQPALPFPRSLWLRLTAAYAVVTVVGLVALLLAASVMTDYVYFRRGMSAEAVDGALTALAADVGREIAEHPGELPQIVARARDKFAKPQFGADAYHAYRIDYAIAPNVEMAVVDAAGHIIAAAPTDSRACAAQFPGAVQVGDVTTAVVRVGDANYLCASVQADFDFAQALKSNWAWITAGLPYAFVLAAILGLAFGGAVARHLSRRLNNIASVAQSWSTGDFKTKIADASGDELTLLAQQLNRMSDELKDVVALRDYQTAAEERYRVARDLHDTVKQQLFAIAMQVAAARARNRNPLVAAAVSEAERLLQQTQRDLMGIIGELHPNGGTAMSLGQRLALVAADFTARFGARVATSIDNGITADVATETHILRIAGEALNNCAKHAKSSSISLDLRRNTDRVELRISDDGIGFDPATPSPGLGLASIRSRSAELPHGTFICRAAPGRGTELIVSWARIRAAA